MKKFVDIAERIKNILNIHTDASVAEALGITPANLSSYKRRNAIPYNEITELCRKKSISIEYILYGTGSPHSSNRPVEMPGQQAIPPNTSQSPPSVSGPDIKFSLLLAKTMNILKSGTLFARNLESSIEALDFSLTCMNELETTKKKIDNLQSRVSQLETTLSEEKEESSGEEDH